jgi:predicted RNA binding protein YcfA (HicA-like mRNA interferase family)
MARLRPIKYREFIAKLRRLGLSGPFSGGRHPYFLFADKRKVTIPNFHNKDITVPLLKIIIRKLEITEKEFVDL